MLCITKHDTWCSRACIVHFITCSKLGAGPACYRNVHFRLPFAVCAMVKVGDSPLAGCAVHTQLGHRPKGLIACCWVCLLKPADVGLPSQLHPQICEQPPTLVQYLQSLLGSADAQHLLCKHFCWEDGCAAMSLLGTMQNMRKCGT